MCADDTPVADAIVGRKLVYFANGASETTLYDRDKLQPGHQLAGPAILFQYDTTIVVPPDWNVDVDQYRNLVITRRSP